jgi:hypothetical protein
MKVIKAKAGKAKQAIHSLMKGPPREAAADRVLVVYGEQSARIYYDESPAPPKGADRPS